MRQDRNLTNSKHPTYISPQISFVELSINVITESPAYDPNEGEWDVEGEE